jgi:hypothetical protein
MSVKKYAPALLGLFWPFMVALAGVGLTAVGVEFTDPQAYSLLAVAFFGSPVLAWGVYKALPSRWAENTRSLVSLAITIPLVLIEIWLALMLFVTGHIAVGGYVP